MVLMIVMVWWCKRCVVNVVLLVVKTISSYNASDSSEEVACV